MKLKIIVILFLSFTFNVPSSYSLIFPQNELLILENEGFLGYLVTPTEFGKISECSVNVGKLHLNLNSDQEYSIEEHTKVRRFSPTTCGLRVQDVKKSVAGVWKLSATYDSGRILSDGLNLQVESSKSNFRELNITVDRDTTSVSITCPDSDAARTCRILDSENNVFYECVKSFKLKNSGNTFKCKLFYWGDMKEVESRINVVFDDKPRNVITTFKETDTHVVASCKYISRVQNCRAQFVKSDRQHDVELYLMDGHLTEHYSAYDTRITDGRCSLEIEKPLHDVDHGVLRIFTYITKIRYTGCVFQVGNKDARSFASTRKHIDIFHDPKSGGTVTEISCEAAYELKYCYLQGPTANAQTPKNFEDLKHLGLCVFEVVNITTGSWACGLNDQNGGNDHLMYYDVNVYDTPAQTSTNEIKGNRGDTDKILLCKTILDLSIDYCRFTTPKGVIHSVSDDNKEPNDRFKYFGAGLASGECGIEIKHLADEDFGTWKCSFKVDSKEYTLGIAVTEEAMSTAAVVGITIGVIIVVVGALGFIVFRRYNRNRIYGDDHGHASARFSSNES